jgi:hypothetical protein
MRAILRSISGLRPGTIYPVDTRITLGRAAVADVQLVDEEVSRFHALIEKDGEGQHVIADLASKAGLRVDGQVVTRATLRAGTVVEICGFRLSYELVEDDTPIVVPPKVGGPIALRQTKRRQSAIPRVVDRVPDRTVKEESRNEPAWLEVVRAVLAYQNAMAVGDRTSKGAAALVDRFCKPDEGPGPQRNRNSRREPCGGPVLIGVRRGPEVVMTVGHIVDIGIDGARVRGDDVLPVGEDCWLLVATGEGERAGIAFSARVVWNHRASREAGVRFVGRPVSGADVLPPMRRA